MTLEEEHWKYTSKVLVLGILLGNKLKLEYPKDKEEISNLIELIGEIYKEAFKHGAKHTKEDKK